MALFVVAIVVSGLLVLSTRYVRENVAWRATVTPLASIIGSGFLVVAPLLGHAVGRSAPFAMLSIVVVAYLVGGAIRYNMIQMEVTEAQGASDGVVALERAAGLALAFSYFISVTFYLRLLAAFVLRQDSEAGEFIERALTTALLVAIAGLGWWRGLGALERLEQFSVSVKLAVIAALVVAWSIHDAETYPWNVPEFSVADPWRTARVLAGFVIVVQGFETSRYLGAAYDTATRVRTMRIAQLASGAIYVAFVALCVPTFAALPARADETAIIELSAQVSAVLPPLLVMGAVMSQLSAAVADTVGAGGLVSQSAIGVRPITPQHGYLLVGIAGVILVWTADVFEIIAFASRAFTIYYAIQSLIASRYAVAARDRPRSFGYGLLSLLLLVAAVVAVPVEG